MIDIIVIGAGPAGCVLAATSRSRRARRTCWYCVSMGGRVMDHRRTRFQCGPVGACGPTGIRNSKLGQIRHRRERGRFWDYPPTCYARARRSSRDARGHFFPCASRSSSRGSGPTVREHVALPRFGPAHVSKPRAAFRASAEERYSFARWREAGGLQSRFDGGK